MVLVSPSSTAQVASSALKRGVSAYRIGGLRAFRVAVVGDVVSAAVRVGFWEDLDPRFPSLALCVEVGRRFSLPRRAGSLYITARDNTRHGVAGRLMHLLAALNPDLQHKPDVHALLKALVEVQVQALWQRRLDHSVLRAIIVIACPSQDTAVVLTRMLDSVVELTSRIDAVALRAGGPGAHRGALTASTRAVLRPWSPVGEHNSRAYKLAAVAAARRRRPLATLEAGEAMRVYQCDALPLSPADIQLIARFRADSRAVLALKRGGSEAIVRALTQRAGEAALRQLSWGSAAPQQQVLCLPDRAGAGDAAASASAAGEEGGADACAAEEENGPPVCPITLEPVLSASGHLLPDTVALLQQDQRGLVRAYLYRGSALLEWLRISPEPTNPATRSPVALEDIFRLR